MTSHGPRPFTAPNLAWQKDSLCREYDAEIFFPLSTADPATVIAKRICGRCPVQAQCLTWAVDTGEDYGVFGGRTAKERRRYGTGPLPARLAAPEPQPEPQPEPLPAADEIRAVRVQARTQNCTKPGHKPTDMRKRHGRSNSYYCQACAADRKRRCRARQAEAVSA